MNLQPLCDRYAVLLKLTDWKVTARYAVPGEIRPGNVGQLEWALAAKGRSSATVLVDPGKHHDHEVTLAHELCHIPLLGIPIKTKGAAAAQELAVDQFAGALVKLRRCVDEVIW